jgi:hypothetical protein
MTWWNSSIHTWCKHCSERRLITECKFIVNFGYQCPECGRRTRTKAHSRSIYRPVVKSKHQIDTEIRQLAGIPFNKSEYDKQYQKEHPEVKQRFYERHPHYNRDYQRRYRLGQKAEARSVI